MRTPLYHPPLSIVLRISLLYLGILSFGGCSNEDKLYCDANKPCTDPARPFCDLNGQFSESQGIGHTCIPRPGHTNPDTDAGFTDRDPIVPCTNSQSCSSTAPICIDQVCSSCSTDSHCVDLAQDTPYCTEGICTACRGNDTCGVAQPICDSETQACRVCTRHAECASGACDLQNGTCVKTETLIYINNSFGEDGPNCGANPGSACQTVSGKNGALQQITATRDTLVFAAGTHTESILIEDLANEYPAITILGSDTQLTTSGGDAIVTIKNANVTVLDVQLLGTPGILHSGIECSDGTLVLDRVKIHNNDEAGVYSVFCNLSINNSEFAHNGEEAIFVTRGSIAIRNTNVHQNTGIGLDAFLADIQILRSTFFKNSGGGLYLQDSSFFVENTIIAQNGSMSPNELRYTGGIAIRGNAIGVPNTIRHTTIADNTTGLADVSGIDCGTTLASVSNSIIHGNAAPQVSATCAVTHSIVDVLGEGNRTEAPKFVNPQSEDYHLLPGSAGIDVAAESDTDVDVDNQTRGDSLAKDMGADEV